MRNPLILLGMNILFLGLFSLGLAQEESITFTTYYPSPYGVYREMRAQRMAIGESYSNYNTVCWEGDTGCSGMSGQVKIPSANDTDLIVQGNVGIGTTEPVAQSSLTTAGGISVLGSDADWNLGGNRLAIDVQLPGAGAWGRVVTTSGGGVAVSGTNIQNAAYFTTGGNVGIGTTNPGVQLQATGQVALATTWGGVGIGTANAETELHIRSTDGAEGNADLILEGQNPTAGIATKWDLASVGGDGHFEIHDLTSDLVPVRIQKATLENTLYLTSAGNVGIGTDSPSQKLDVLGQIHATGDICTDQGGVVCLSAGAGGGQVTSNSQSNCIWKIGGDSSDEGGPLPSDTIYLCPSGYFVRGVRTASGTSQISDFLCCRVVSQ